MEVLSWLIRSVPLASAAALAQMLAPSALSLPLNNQNSNAKNTGLARPVFFLSQKGKETWLIIFIPTPASPVAPAQITALWASSATPAPTTRSIPVSALIAAAAPQPAPRMPSNSNKKVHTPNLRCKMTCGADSFLL